MKSTKLVPVTPVDLVVIPKPKRAEIIAALVEVARKEHAAIVDTLKREKEAAVLAFKRAVIKLLRTDQKLLHLLGVETRHRGAELRLEDEQFSPAVAAAHEAARTLESKYIKSFDEAHVRREIIRKLDGAEAPSERVAKLVGSEAIAALWKHINAA